MILSKVETRKPRQSESAIAGSGKWIPHSRPLLDSDEANAVNETVKSGFVGRGQRVESFERGVTGKIGHTMGVGMSSGSAALHVALKIIGVGPGDEVIIPAFVCKAVLNSVLLAGATPVLADIGEDLIMMPDSVAARRTRKTKAVVVVHMFGAAAPIDEIVALGVPVIEDAASSYGSELDGRKLGSIGPVSVLSFASTKMITTGQGGMLLTSDVGLAEKARAFIDYDAPPGGELTASFNYNMTDVQAAIGTSQLARLQDFVTRRRAIAAEYGKAIQNSKTLRAVHSFERTGFCPYRFVLRTNRDSTALAADFRNARVDARSGIAHILSDYLRENPTDYPGTEAIRNRLLSVPIYPAMSDDDVDLVSSLLRRAASE
jgi:dTDP-4-amino-4,6-dideoxygalactose transaminase